MVTGASSGIGRATAQAFAQAGSRLVLAARRREKLVELARVIGEERALVVPTDVTDRAQVNRLAETALAQWGRVDVLVNNAGLGMRASWLEASEEDVRYLFAVNFFGPLYAIQAIAPLMRRQGTGVIVNVSSIVGQRSIPHSGAYCATKSALNALTDGLRVELAGSGIQVISVYPGVTQTAFPDHVRGGPAQSQLGQHWQGVPPEKVARRIVQAVRRGERDVYVSFVDHLFVSVAAVTPWALDWLLARLVGRRAAA